MSAWERVTLRRLYRRRDVTDRADLPMLSVYRDLGVVPREGREDNNNRPGEDLAAYRLVRVGDLVINKMKTWQGSIAVSSYLGIVSPAYFVAEPASRQVDGAFMHHLLRSQPLIAEYGKRSKGIRPAQWDLPWEEFADIVVALPPLSEQRAIADFLDRETARIGALITAKRRMVDVVGERASRFAEQTFRELSERHPRSPLKYAVRRVEVGIVVTPSAWYVDDGVPALRGLNIKPGHIQVEDLVKISTHGHEFHRKSQLNSGDIVVVRTGQAGAAAVVPPELNGVNCIDLVIVRPASVLNSKYLEHVLNSEWAQEHIEENSVGSIQSHFNVGAMKEMPIPLPSMDEQVHIVGRLDAAAALSAKVVEALAGQIDLLVEHRQALITAAVTGELEIPGIAA